MRLLVVRVGAMGDVLHALPAIAALRRARPAWEIDWVVNPRWASLLLDEDPQDAHPGQRDPDSPAPASSDESSSPVSSGASSSSASGSSSSAPASSAPASSDPGYWAHGYPDPRGPVVSGLLFAEVNLWKAAPWSLRTLRSILALRRRLRQQRYDLVVDLQGTLRSAVIGRLAGAKVFAGFTDPREPAAARFYSHRFSRTGAHVVEQGAALLTAATGVALPLHQAGRGPTPLGVPLPRAAWAEEWAAATAVTSRPLCVLGVGGGWGAKLWPAERYGALARQLHAQGFDVAVSSPRQSDPEAMQAVAASAGAARMVVCNVAGLTALLRRTDLFVGGDTGPTHLAAALAVPTVALFGPTDPARNGPWGPGPVVVLRDPAALTSYKRSPARDPGLARMTVEQVMAATRQVAPGRTQPLSPPADPGPRPPQL